MCLSLAWIRRVIMEFVSIRVITDDVARLAGFYERVTGTRATWANENFAELRTAAATLAIASVRTVPLFAPGAARPAANSTEDVVLEPTTMPARPGCTARPRPAAHRDAAGCRASG
jgi:hypothetical protein